MRLLAQRGGAFPNLLQAREFTIEQIRERRSQLGRVHCPNGLWKEISTCGDELQQSLLALMFGKELTPLTKQFAIF